MIAATVLQRSLIGVGLISGFTALMVLDNLEPFTGWGAIVLIVSGAVAGLRELSGLLRPTAPLWGWPLALGGGGLVFLRGLGYQLAPAQRPLVQVLEAGWLFGLACAAFFALCLGTPERRRLLGLFASAFALMYVAWLGAFALDVRFLGPAQGVDPEVGPWAFAFVIAISKGTDIAAFFSGKAFGRDKLIPSVSPGKTTAGFGGALAGGAAITALFCWLTPLGRALPLPLAPGVGIVLALVVVLGDLIESFLKRSLEIKDSAKLLPGFGGVLDVVDSVVLAAPAVYFLLRGVALCRAGVGG